MSSRLPRSGTMPSASASRIERAALFGQAGETVSADGPAVARLHVGQPEAAGRDQRQAGDRGLLQP